MGFQQKHKSAQVSRLTIALSALGATKADSVMYQEERNTCIAVCSEVGPLVLWINLSSYVDTVAQCVI